MSSENTIVIDNVSKCYQIYDQPRDRLKQFVIPRLRAMVKQPPKQYFREFWALRNISFNVAKGETVGIIGRNGSGKSTLLQIICGTLNATGGTVQTSGRIGALLELGSGFNPEFTGRENVYMNAAVLGLSTDEIDACYDDILAFADIGDFVNQPVKTYSSGMMVRLAFAVQAQVSPDILIVDEALAVGDAKFQAKCFERLRQLKENGTSILLVTHANEQVVTHCSQAVLLNSGEIVEQGSPRKVVNRYLDLLFGKKAVPLEEKPGPGEAAASPGQSGEEDTAPEHQSYGLNLHEDVFTTRIGHNPHEYRWGDRTASILDFYLAADGDPYPTAVSSGQKITLAVAVRFNGMLMRPIFGITVKTKEGVTVYGANSETLEVDVVKTLGSKGGAAVLSAGFQCLLAPGDYFISLGVATERGGEIIPHDRRYDAIHLQVRPGTDFFGLVDLGLDMHIEEVAK